MQFETKALVLILPLILGGVTAHASDFFCNNYVAGAPLQHFQCVQTSVGPGTPLVLSLDQAGSGPRFASSVSSGSGPFASASSANASASPGLLRGFASAEMLGGSIENAQAVAVSDAWFADGGTVTGAPGVVVGTPVSLRFTIDVGGAFAGGAPFHPESEANVDLVVSGPNGAFINTGSTINKLKPTGFVTSDMNAFVGDSFEMIMKLHVFAGAINATKPGDASSVADVSNTSHLYVDVLSANANFVGSGGHLYASVAAVPEPSVYAMLLSGLFVAGVLARRRARHGLG